MSRTRKKSAPRLALLALALGTVACLLWWRVRPLGSTTLPDGTEIVFEHYTHGTAHEFGSRDLRTVITWVPAGFWKMCGYKAPFHAELRQAEPCTILWVRVRWQVDRMEPWPADLHVQVVEKDGAAYSWKLVEVRRPSPREFVLPYRTDSLPMPGGRLSVRFVEKLEQRQALARHLSKEREARDEGLRPPRKQASALLSLPNPSRAKSAASTSPPLPQMREQDGLRATVSAIRVTPRADGEFMVEPQVELLWNGAKLPDAFRHYWSISTPGGPRIEPGFRLFPFIDHMPERPAQPAQLPKAPMRGHSAWTLHLDVVTTASFPELAKEPGIPLFTAPVAARLQQGEPRPSAPTVSPEATSAGLGIADIWPPMFLRIVVHRTPARWFPEGWKRSDPLPFVVVAEAEGKRVVLRGSSTGGGYGRYGLGSFDFGDNDFVERLAYGRDRPSGMGRLPASERPALPDTVEYRLIPRRYWKFEFVVTPPELPPPADSE